MYYYYYIIISIIHIYLHIMDYQLQSTWFPHIRTIATHPKEWFVQWPFQEPKLEVPTIYKAYIRPM